MIIEVVATATDEVYRTVNLTVLEVCTVARHLRILVGLHTDILHHRLVTAIDGNCHTVLIIQSVVLIVANCEVLQVIALTVAQVQHRIRDTIAGAVDDNTITALTDE